MGSPTHELLININSKTNIKLISSTQKLACPWRISDIELH